MKKRRRAIIISILLVLVWMGIIFNLSHQPVEKSNALSKGITNYIVDIMERISNNREFNISKVNHYIRKSAHFIAYLLLAILVVNLLVRLRIYGFRALIYAFIVTILFAASDEIHQLFIPGRGGQLKDVFIDGIGALTGLILASTIQYKYIFKNK